MFSDERVIDAVNSRYVAAWDSVAPVRLITYDLGAGRRVRGTVNGEIALYKCDADGRVLDILPGVQTPEVVLAWLRESVRVIAWYDEATEGQYKADEKAWRYTARVKESDSSVSGWGSKFLKVAEIKELDFDPVLIIQAGGAGPRLDQVRKYLASGPPRLPRECTSFVFEVVLGQSLASTPEATNAPRTAVSIHVVED